ncbi:MAG TPA: alkaline phosphatase family protein, partial [Actinomycetota bacterium]|nr:alkaline phosphatase family protein [Actinomycetota bacterium]
MRGPRDPNSSYEIDPVARCERPDDERSPFFSRRRFLRTSGLAIAGAALYSCTGGGRNRPVVTKTATRSITATDTRWPVKRVVYVMPENRSFDNIYGRFPGANGATTGVKFGEEVPLTPAPQWLPGDLPHDRAAYLNSVNGGAYDGFGIGQFGDPWAYTTLEADMVPVYWQLAQDYVLCDNFFCSVGGPSYPNHFFFVAGQSGGVLDNPENIEVRKDENGVFKSWGCDAVGEEVFVFVKDEEGNLTKHDTCFDFRTVPEQLEEIGVSWAYYSARPYQAGYFWNALNAISGVFHTDLWRPERIRPVDRIVDDIREEKLPAVTWVTPRFELSGHPPESTCFAQNWLAGIVNAVMQSEAWKHTALFIAWDMWGGLYDHVPPPVVDDLG